MKKKGIVRRMLGGWLTLLIGNVLSLLLVSSTLGFAEGQIVVQILITILVLVIQFMLLFGNAYEDGHEDLKWTRRKMEVKPHMGIKVGLLVSIPIYLAWLMALLSRLKVIPDLLWLYQLVNSCFLQVVQIFTPNTVLENFNAGALITLFFLSSLFPCVYIFGYQLGFKDVDLKYELMYKKKKRES